MKKAWIFIAVALSILSILTGCIRKPIDNDNIQKTDEFYFGYKPLPKEFLKFWFENIEKIRSGELDPIKFSLDSKLPASSKQIADAQIIFTEPLTASLPSSYLAPHTHPKYQGENGTCWAFTTVGSLESALLTQLGPSEIADRYPFLNPYNPDLSEQFVAYYNLSQYDESNLYRITAQESNKDTGGNLFFSTFNIIRRGVPEEEDFPYITDEQGWIKWNAASENWKYNLVRPYKTVCIYDFYSHRAVYNDYTKYINTIKSAIIEYGAVAAAFMVYDDFGNYWSGTKGKVYVKSPSASLRGGHAVLIVGWVDNYQDPESGYQGPIWVIKNSWGTDGGFSLRDYGLSSDTTKGYFALPMLTEGEYNSGERVDWKVEYNEMYVPVVKSNQGGTNQESRYTIIAEDQTYSLFRLNYIDVQVVDENGFPASGVKVKMVYSYYPNPNVWKPVYDELTWNDVFVTDENGCIKVAFGGYMGDGSYRIKAYLYDQPEVSKEFTVTLELESHRFLVWMCADNDLESYALRDLEEMKNTNENAALVVMFDGKNRKDKLLVLDEYGEWQNALDFWSLNNLGPNPFAGMTDFDSGDPEFLKMILQVAFNANGDPWSLILWDHGSAWIGDYQSTKGQNYSPKAICFDETSKNSISTVELSAVLKELADQGRKVNLVGMDACLMGSIEVLYELKDAVDYVVASSFTVPGDGFDYNFLKQISTSDSTLDVGKKIVDAFKDYYHNTYWKDLGLSLAVYDMSKVQSVISGINGLGITLVGIMNDTIRNTISSFYPSLIQYYYDVYNNPVPLLVDLNNCAQLMGLNINDSNIQYHAQQIQDALEQLVVYEYAEKTVYGDINNPVSIFMPNSAQKVTDYADDYNTLSFTREFFWSDFLEAWLQTGDVLRSR